MPLVRVNINSKNSDFKALCDGMSAVSISSELGNALHILPHTAVYEHGLAPLQEAAEMLSVISLFCLPGKSSPRRVLSGKKGTQPCVLVFFLSGNLYFQNQS